MNLTEVLSKYTAEFFEFVKAGANAVGQQVPLYVDELIKFEIIKNSFYVVGLLACIIITAILTYKLVTLGWKMVKECNDFGYPVMIVTSFVGVLGTAMMLTIFSEYSIKLIKVSVAPRVYIVEQIQEIIKR